MEEAAVHGGAIQHSQCAAKRERQDGLAAEFSSDLLEARSDLLKSLVPTDALPLRLMWILLVWGRVGACPERSRRTPSRSGAPRPSWPFRPHPPHRIQNPVRRIHPIQILGHLGAQETTGHGMHRITLDLGRTTVLHGNQHSAGIRAIVRTGGVNDLLHDVLIIRCLALLNQLARANRNCSVACNGFSASSAAVLSDLCVSRFWQNGSFSS